MISRSWGNSYTRHRDLTPKLFKCGVTAKTTDPSPLDLSETTKSVVKGSSPRKTHSTEA